MRSKSGTLGARYATKRRRSQEVGRRVPRVTTLARWRYFGIGVALIVLAGTACTGDDNGQTGATSTSATTPPTATATTAAATAEPTLTPAPASPDGYPLSRSTGVKDVDDILAAIASGNIGRIEPLFSETASPCVVDPQSITNPPRCGAGIPAGTAMPIFRASACDSVWPDYLLTALAGWFSQPQLVYAVYSQAPMAYSWLPAAQYAVVFNEPKANGSGSFIRITDGKITGWAFGCGQPPSTLLSGVSASQYVVAPPAPR